MLENFVFLSVERRRNMKPKKSSEFINKEAGDRDRARRV